MDYSLMVAVDEVNSPDNDGNNLTDAHKARKELVVGIIDVVRTYTWVSKSDPWLSARILIVIGQKARVVDQR
jgi:1-phosphatidylinositol-3-phosphate 5-kinase